MVVCDLLGNYTFNYLLLLSEQYQCLKSMQSVVDINICYIGIVKQDSPKGKIIVWFLDCERRLGAYDAIIMPRR